MKLLGELEIELCGKKYQLKPTFTALATTEDLCGRSLSELLKLFLSSKAGVKEVAAVIYGGMLGKNGDKQPPLSYTEVGGLIIAQGFASLQPLCMVYLGSAYSGNPVDELIRQREAAKKMGSEEKKTDQDPVIELAPATPTAQ